MTILTECDTMLTDATLTIRNVPAGPRETLRRLVFARWILLQLVALDRKPRR
jgi:hypothetical protein